MPERKYSVAEIDRLRDAIRWSYPSGVPFYEKDRNADIEDRLRTYMLNGTDPAELEQQNAERRSAIAKLRRE